MAEWERSELIGPGHGPVRHAYDVSGSGDQRGAHGDHRGSDQTSSTRHDDGRARKRLSSRAPKPSAVNSDSLATWFLPALTRVPGELRLCFELRREDQDHTAALLREGLVMAAVTSSPDPVTGCSVRALGRMRYVPVESPGFTQKWLGGWPDVPVREVIGDAPLVVFDLHDGLQDGFVRALRGGRVASSLRHFMPTSEGFVDAAMAGMGWGMVPEAQAGPLLRDGRLVYLAPDRNVDVPLFWQQWKLDSPALAAVAEAVAAVAAETLAAKRGV